MSTLKLLDWTIALSLDDSLRILDGFALKHASRAGKNGPELVRLILAEKYKDLCAYKIDLTDPSWDHSQLYHTRQVVALYKKLEDLEIGVDKEAVATADFLAAERRNKENNDSLRLFIGQVNKHSRQTVASVLPNFTALFFAVKEKFEQTLGVAPALSELRFKFGPGATTSVKRRDSNPGNKLAEAPQCSMNLVHSHLFPEFIRTNPWLDFHATSFSIDEGTENDEKSLVGHYDIAIRNGRIVFVAKNAGTFRIIDTQPTLNGYYQLGVGYAIEERLLRVGVDIHDQTKNQRLARSGSLFGHIATIDLRGASNSIFYMLVKALSRADWFDLLNAGRTASTELHGEVHSLEMFSAMGNGYTFPLETLIFWCITSVVCSDVSADLVGVYGDDIICPTHKVGQVINALKAFGFSINLEKSFTSGPFRESCGSDYYQATDVRPYYQKHLVNGESLFVLHNFYYRRGLFSFAKDVVSLIPRGMRIYGPDGYGDGHLLSSKWPTKAFRKTRKYVTYEAPYCNLQWLPPLALREDWQETRKKVRLGDGYAGETFRTYSSIGKKQVSRFPGDICAPLYACEFNARVPVLETTWVSPDGRKRVVSNACPVETTPVKFHNDGRPYWELPGTEGYEVTEVYTLEDVLVTKAP